MAAIRRYVPRIFLAIGLIGICFSIWAVSQFLLVPDIVVSKETTFIVEPLSEDGLPDYEAYFLTKGFEGVTSDNNAAVLLWQALWPGELDPRDWDNMCYALGMSEIPSQKRSLVAVYDQSVLETIADWVLEELPRPVNRDINDWIDFLQHEHGRAIVDQASLRAWNSEKIPPLAKWVNENAFALDLLLQASKRPEFYSPPPNYLDRSREGIIATLLPLAQEMRVATRALNVRSMWSLGKGNIESAWTDLEANLKFAQFNANGNHLVEHLVGIEIEGATLPLVVQVLSSEEITEKQAFEILIALRDLPRFPGIHEKVDKGERLTAVEGVLALATGRSDAANSYGESLLYWSADFNLVLQRVNDQYDQLVEAGSIGDRSVRYSRMGELENDLLDRGSGEKTASGTLGSFISRDRRSNTIADIYLVLVTPVLGDVYEAQDRAATTRNLTIVAAALAVHRARHGEYPDTLDELVPDVLEATPLDLYSEKPFLYESKEDGGYVLYSVFENGLDDGGDHYTGEIVDGEWVDEPRELDPSEGDLVIRVPVPKFEMPSLDPIESD